ncbi:MAG: porin family protein [Alphaproteobacteria bacterium]|nr:porin family protein [Alphaproteobacteria bacterium]
MKKILLITVLCTSTINAYAESGDGVPSSYYGGYPSEYAANNQAGTLQPTKSGYKVYIDTTQNPEHIYTRTYPLAYGYAEQTPQATSLPQPIYKPSYATPTSPAPSKRYYGVLRLGYGSTHGMGSPYKTPHSVLFSGAIGMYLPAQFRADIDLTYHTKESLYKGALVNFDYAQYDLGVNGYYDFSVSQTIKPFVGLGLGLTKNEVSGKKTPILKKPDDGVHLAFSVAGGLDYYLTPKIALEALLRIRYIFADKNLYNIEGLLGAKYDF